MIYVECRIEKDEFLTTRKINLGIEKNSCQPALITSVNPANLTEPLGSNIWYVFSGWMNHPTSFCFPGFVDVASVQGSNLF